MHPVTVRKEIADRVLQRRGRYHLFDRLDPARTALIVIDMQSTFCAPGGPAEVPASRGIVEPMNRLTPELRTLGVPVIWVLHENQGDGSDWRGFYDVFVLEKNRAKAAAALTAGNELQKQWPQLDVSLQDLHVTKNRYSALIAGSSKLEKILEKKSVDTLLIAGTKTNVCCECTARDAMMLDYKVVMLSDCTAALSDDEHRATLENVIQQFGDVRTAEEVLTLFDR